MQGTIRHRLLVNALVDPDEAARHLPDGLRPHIAEDATVVGCCLLSIDRVRPAGFPAKFGRPLVAVAHRISATWDDEAGETNVGVFVPVRPTTSAPARVIGGRWFPGVHRPATIGHDVTSCNQSWSVEPRSSADRYSIRVRATVAPGEATEPFEPTGETCLSAAVGVSPDGRGVLEAARMEPDHHLANQVEIDKLDSHFLDAFTSIRPTTSYLMRDVQVRWTRASAPAVAATGGAG